MTANYLGFLGLCFDILGALLILSGVFLPTSKAIAAGVPTLAGRTDAENLKLPSVANLLLQSRRAALGTASLLLGFILQAAGVWPF